MVIIVGRVAARDSDDMFDGISSIEDTGE